MKKTRWINFIGGNNLLFSLIALILIGILFMLGREVEFIFTPIITILSNILMPAVIALLLYYLFNPLIDLLEKWKIRRLLGVVILYLLIIGLIVLGVVLLYPFLRDQIVGFVDNFPDFVNSLIGSVTDWLDTIPFSEELNSMIQEGEDFINSIQDNLGGYISDGLSGLSSVVAGVTNFVITLVTFPIILFFMLKDEKKFFHAVLAIIPPKWREDLLRVSSEVNTQVGAYIKGQLIVAVSIGIMMFIGFTIIGLDYNGVLAIIAGFTSIIPYVGPTLAFLPALVIALIDSWWMVLQLLIVWAVVQFVDGNLIEPNVMGKQLNVHPLTIIIVLLVMGDLLGILGLIFGVPIYAILKVIVVHFFQQYKKRYNRFYGDIAGKYNVKAIEVAVSGERKKDQEMERTIEIAKLKQKREKENMEDNSNEETDNTDNKDNE